MDITTNKTQVILNLKAELATAESTSSNNFQAMQIVTDYLIEIDALITPHEGEGEAAGLNIVDSIKSLLANLSKPQPTPSQSDDEPVGYIDEFGNFENSLKEWMKDEPNVNWKPVYSKPQPTSQDTERLDFIQSMTKGYGTGWIFRDSVQRRGMRLHETTDEKAKPTVREAIDAAMKESK